MERERIEPTTLTEAAQYLVPGRRIASVSNPEPPLRAHNVLGVSPSAEAARRIVVELEGIEADDAAIGLVVFGGDARAVDAASRDAVAAARATGETVPEGTGQIDPERATGALVPRLLTGGLAGFVIGAVVVGVGAALLGAGGATIGAAIGGAAMGAVFGAIWAVFAGFGGSDAYRQTFVDPADDDVSVVSLHTDDPAEAVEARRRMSALDEVVVLDQHGHVRRT